jgi:hypothetical protein
MKLHLLAFFTLINVSAVKAQYYYFDIVGTKQTNQQYMLLRNFQVKKISATSYEGNDVSKDFVLEQKVSGDGKQIITRSASIGNAESYFTSNFLNNKVIRTVDSGNNAIVIVDYIYDNAGKVVSVNSFSRDFDGNFNNTETHAWTYNEKGQPERMIKVKNISDTTVVSFTYDENDNVAEEKWSRNKRLTETYYYYYNNKKLITDIVRYNRKAKQLLPDYMFEYDNAGHVTQMTQTQSGRANYLVWKYTYNDRGMKEKEIVYNKQKEMLGRIEYIYQ